MIPLKSLSFLLIFPALSAATAAPPQASAPYNIRETVLGPWFDGRKEKQVSPDGRHVAYFIARPGGVAVVLDSKVGKTYDEIQGLAFSRDGARFVYAARQGAKWKLVDNDVESAGFDAIDGSPIFLDNSKHVAFAATREGKHFVVVDGKEGDPFDGVGPLQPVHPENRKLTYTAKLGDKTFCFTDDKKIELLNVSDSVLLSDDGLHIAFPAKKDDREVVVVDGKEFPAYDGLLDRAFSPDGKRFAYSARSKNQHYINYDGRVGAFCSRIDEIHFSPNSKHIAFLAKSGNTWQAVIDGVAGPPYDEIVTPGVVLAGDRSAYVARQGDKYIAVVDGKPSAPFDRLLTTNKEWLPEIIFSPDFQHVGYVTAHDGKLTLVLDGKEGPLVAATAFDRVTFSPSGNRLFGVGVGFNGDALRETVLVDGKAGPTEDSVYEPSPIFSPTGRHFAYIAQRAEGQFVVYDWKASEGYFRVHPASICFTSDDRLVYFTTTHGLKDVIVIDGKQGPEYDDIVSNQPYIGPGGTIEFLAVKANQLLRVAYTPRP